jgi:hypothetical protein
VKIRPMLMLLYETPHLIWNTPTITSIARWTSTSIINFRFAMVLCHVLQIVEANVIQNERWIPQMMNSKKGLFIDAPGQIDSSLRGFVNPMGSFDIAHRSKFRFVSWLQSPTLFSGASRFTTNMKLSDSIAVENSKVVRLTLLCSSGSMIKNTMKKIISIEFITARSCWGNVSHMQKQSLAVEKRAARDLL